MSEKLGIGAVFPDMTINVDGGGAINIPTDLSAKYRVVLFYRGHW